MDVDDEAVANALRRHGVATLIHGHTHRPDQHLFALDGRPAKRWVLPEWHAERAGFLCADADLGLSLQWITP
jgi:UDP-2,3-diacylglucosamine hydrolase